MYKKMQQLEERDTGSVRFYWCHAPCVRFLSLVVNLLKSLHLGLLTMHTVQASVLIMNYGKEQEIYLHNYNSAGFLRTFPPQQCDPCFAVLQSHQ